MKSASAIKKFMDTPGFNPEMVYTKPSMMEIKEFRTSCSDEEWKKLGRQACEAIGEEFEE